MMNQQEIRDAIEWLTVRRNVHEAYTNANPSIGTHYYDLAIHALQQMRTEPCEWCKNREHNKDLPLKPCANGDTGTAATIMNGGIVILKHNGAMGYIDINYCPNCGRQLDLSASESTQAGAIRQARSDDE